MGCGTLIIIHYHVECTDRAYLLSPSCPAPATHPVPATLPTPTTVPARPQPSLRQATGKCHNDRVLRSPDSRPKTRLRGDRVHHSRAHHLRLAASPWPDPTPFENLCNGNFVFPEKSVYLWLLRKPRRIVTSLKPTRLTRGYYICNVIVPRVSNNKGRDNTC